MSLKKHCIVKGCTSSNIFFSIPIKREKFLEWKKACEEFVELIPRRHICSFHFKENYIVRKRFLTKEGPILSEYQKPKLTSDAVPTIFVNLETQDKFEDRPSTINNCDKNKLFRTYSEPKNRQEKVELLLNNEITIQVINSNDEEDNSHLFFTDEDINRYMDLINERSPDTVYAFNSFFYFALSEKGYDHVCRWTKRVDIFSKNKLFFPIHVDEENHWCLVCVDFQEKAIKYYDSFRGRNFKCLKSILKYLVLEHINKKGKEFQQEGWKLIHEKKCPKQRNNWDCGVFVCMYAEYLSRDAPMNFSQKHMTKFRKQILFEVKNNKLIHSIQSSNNAD